MHPFAKFSEQNRILSCRFNHGGCDYTSSSQVFQKQARTIEQLQPVTVTVTRAFALIKVAVETLNKLLG
jgi:hypothetical protein